MKFFINLPVTFLVLSTAVWAYASPQLAAPVASSDGKTLTYVVSYSGYSPAPSPLRLFLQSSAGSQTGYSFGMNANYMIQNNRLFKYTGRGGTDWTWSEVKSVSFVNSAGKGTWRVALNDLGNPSAVSVLAQTPAPYAASSKTVQAYTTQKLGTIQPMSTQNVAPLSTASGAIANGAVVTAADHSVVTLSCGKTYYGSLDLENKTDVTVQTEANCNSRAVITPATRVTNWHSYSGRIYVASVEDEVTQVFVDGQLADVAHYPDDVNESGWLQPTSTGANSMDVASLPNSDIAGARVYYRGYPWEIGTQIVTKFDGKTISLGADPDPNIALEGSKFGRFYLEGKLWMLNSPGEWAWSDHKLYIWMPDGQTPSGRVHAVTGVGSVIKSKV